MKKLRFDLSTQPLNNEWYRFKKSNWMKVIKKYGKNSPLFSLTCKHTRVECQGMWTQNGMWYSPLGVSSRGAPGDRNRPRSGPQPDWMALITWWCSKACNTVSTLTMFVLQSSVTMLRNPHCWGFLRIPINLILVLGNRVYKLFFVTKWLPTMYM